MGNIDLGYKDSIRQFVDVNGDGKIDFCREVGNRPHSYISCTLATDDGFQGEVRVNDKGYDDALRQFVDVNGDGKVDYCREINNRPHSSISCTLSTGNEFQGEMAVNDKGYHDSLRQFADVNGDGKADYCREVGNRPHSYVSCALGSANGFQGEMAANDKGYHDSIRQFADVNGDGKADYCREVGNRPHSYVSCALGSASGFQGEMAVNDKGYHDSIRQFVDVNGDGKIDYCREVGNRPQSYFSCIIASDNGFQREFIINDKGYHDSVRRFVDIDGDGKTDFCREVGNRPDSYISCAIAHDDGFDNHGLKFTNADGWE